MANIDQFTVIANLAVLDASPKRYWSKNKVGAKVIRWARRCRCICGKIILKRDEDLVKPDLFGCKDCFQKRRRANSNLNKIAEDVRRAAKYHGYDWTLTIEQATYLIGNNCFCCGSAPNNVQKVGAAKGIKYNGIDRLDNSQGYSELNCVSCCKNCNFWKSNKSYGKFLGYIKIIYERLDLGNNRKDWRII